MRVLVGIVFSFTVLMSYSNALGSELDGQWVTSSGVGVVTIQDCEDQTPCGTLTWVLQGDGQVDEYNPDPAMRVRPLIGIIMLSGYKPKKDYWVSGTIYDPSTGRSYRSKLKLIDNGRLEVKGCLGPICKTQIWNKQRASRQEFEKSD